jgi:type IV secretion system protein VirB11
LAIRKRASRVFSLRDYADQGSITQRQLTLLEAALRARKNVIVAGAAGSGKTTFANALLGHDAVRSDRIVLIEDTPELQCGADDLVTLTTCPSDPVITLRDLVQDALRLRPDRIIVGEVRDGSALELLKAWNTGHPGGIATLHANSARDVLYRLEELVAEVATAPANTLIGRAVDVIVFIGRTPSGRRIEQMLAVASFRDGSYVYADPEESREGEVDPSAAFTR